VISRRQRRLFRRASRTYYWSSVFFPRRFRADVFSLYAFVRTADDIVAFLDAMQSDLGKVHFKSFKDVDKYIHGSAEVIGVFMNRIFGVGKKYDKQAKLLGRAMQYVNWLRDLDEDARLGRQYLPQELLDKYGVAKLDSGGAARHPNGFRHLMHNELSRYQEWQSLAKEGFVHLPRGMLIPVLAASRLYGWTARKIHKDPFVVFERKVKPSVWRVVQTVFACWVSVWLLRNY
jgi:phytoene synthase